mmetsp:Transcript_55649/g.156687  ORF Transcript_55649/g.156687 Transcript_55649/m.156687 type:complete len:213 (-) Transcript_55649:304-942(-)
MDKEYFRMAVRGLCDLRSRPQGLEVRVAGNKPRALHPPLFNAADRRGDIRRALRAPPVVAQPPERHRVQDAPDHTRGFVQLQQNPLDDWRPSRCRYPAGHRPDHLCWDGPGVRWHAPGDHRAPPVASPARALDVARHVPRPALSYVRLQGVQRQPHHALEPCTSDVVLLGPPLPLRPAPRADGGGEGARERDSGLAATAGCSSWRSRHAEKW